MKFGGNVGRFLTRTAAVGAVAAALTSPGAADPVADFYTGKQIRLVVGFTSGGTYDLYARLLARFMGEHIPGKPTFIVQNMPGAGSRLAANWLYTAAPKDGTAMAILGQNTAFDQALGADGVQFDVRNFHWIGNPIVANNVMIAWQASGVSTVEDAKTKEVVIGASGASSPSVIYPQALNSLVGAKFKIVAGYPGGNDIDMAMERREVDGRGSTGWISVKSNPSHAKGIADGTLRVLVQVGPKKERDLPNVPLLTDLAQNEEQRQVFEILSSDVALGRPLLTTPDVPAERVEALRRAFDLTLKDPNFLNEAGKQKLDIDPLTGKELQALVTAAVSKPPAVIASVKNAIQPRNVQELPKKPAGAAPQ
jgi:tripartite-type tricarboxylate transporter receptor subunit TctC